MQLVTEVTKVTIFKIIVFIRMREKTNLKNKNKKNIYITCGFDFKKRYKRYFLIYVFNIR